MSLRSFASLLVLLLSASPAPGLGAVIATRLADPAVQFHRVVFDGAGSRYAAGTVTGPGAVDVDPGPDVHTVAATGTTLEALIVKYDAAGNWLWATTFGGSGTDTFVDLALGGGTVYAVGSSTSLDAGFDGTGTIAVTTVEGGILVALDAATGAPQTGFDGDGVVTFVPVNPAAFFSDFASFEAVTVADGVVYASGHYVHDADGFGFGGRPPVVPGANQGDSEQGLIVALDGTTGAPVVSFAGDGIQFVGGQNDELVHDVEVANGTLYFAGDAETPDIAIGGINGAGTIDNPGFVGALDLATGAPKAGFGTNGLAICSAAFCEVHHLLIANDVVYGAGRTGRGPVQIPGAAGIPTFTNEANEVDDFVLALDRTTGSAKASFGGGLVVVGSPYDPMTQRGRDRAPLELLAAGNTLYLLTVFQRPNGGIGSPGSGELGDSTIVALDAATGAARTAFSADGLETISAGVATDALEWLAGALTCDPSRGLVLAGQLTATTNLFLGSAPATTLASTQGIYTVAFDDIVCDAIPSDVDPPPAPAVPAYLLPKSLKVKLNAKTPAKSTLALAATIDLGVAPVDLTKPASLDIAGHHLDFPALTAKGASFAFKTATVSLQIKTSKAGSSKTELKLKVKGDFGATIPLDGPTALTFTNPDVTGSAVVRLVGGVFGLGRGRGTLIAPTFHLSKAGASLAGAGKDAFTLTAGLATDGTAPVVAPAVTVYFGDGFAAKIAAGAFVRKGDRFAFKGGKTGVTSVVLDYARETIVVKAKGVSLGGFAPGSQAVLVGLRLDGDGRAVLVRMGSSGKKLKY